MGLMSTIQERFKAWWRGLLRWLEIGVEIPAPARARSLPRRARVVERPAPAKKNEPAPEKKPRRRAAKKTVDPAPPEKAKAESRPEQTIVDPATLLMRSQYASMEHGNEGPWSEGRPAPDMDPDVVREKLLTELVALDQECPTAGDRLFVSRLARVVAMRTLDLPPFPDVALQLEKLLAKSNTSAKEIAGLVERDPSLVQAVWRRATSVQFSRPPAGLNGAIARIGTEDLWRVAMRLSMEHEVFRVREYQEEVERIRRHSFAVAETAAWMVGEKGGSTYLAGLLHAVGKLVIYRSAAGGGRDERGSTPFIRKLVAQQHSSIGVLVLQAWNLGPEARGAVAYHHKPEDAPEQARHVSRVIQLADIAAHAAYAEREGEASPARFVLESAKGPQFKPAETIEIAAKALELFDSEQGGDESAP